MVIVLSVKQKNINSLMAKLKINDSLSKQNKN